MRIRFTAGILCLAALSALSGCGGVAGSGSYARVSGVVKHNGTPLAGAKVKFVSAAEDKDGNKLEFAATTDSSGLYGIASIGKQPGMPPGLYKVVVTKLKVKDGATIPDSIKDDPQQLEESKLAVNALPPKYSSTDTSGLSKDLDVGKNTYDIELTES